MIKKDFSSIPGATYGAWSTRRIEVNTVFGPIYADNHANLDENGSIISETKFQEPDKDLDSSWKTYLNCARNKEEENLVTFEVNGSFFLRVTKPIPPNTELLVDDCKRDDCWKQQHLTPAFNKDDNQPLGLSEKVLCTNAFENTDSSSSDEFESSLIPTDVLAIHMTETEEKYIKSDEGDRSFTSSKSPKNHRRTTEKKEFKCELCQYSSGKSGHLKRHMMTHTREKPYKCNECENSFITPCDLRRHSRIHTGVKPYRCNECGNCFTRLDNLNVHMMTHTGEKPFKCNDCGICFTHYSDIINHVRTHTREKPYKCKDCGKCFAQSSSLSKHMRTHATTKIYKCKECDKSFSRSDTLNRHIRTHSAEKPFKCQSCENCFRSLVHLKRHSVIAHSAENPFKCELCEISFSTVGQIQRHLETHAGEKLFKCSECGIYYAHYSDMRTHMKAHTGEEA